MNKPVPIVVLVKPPEQTRFSFGAFSLAVLAAAVRDLAAVHILDATDLTPAETVTKIETLRPDWIGITSMALTSLPAVCQLIGAIRQRLPEVRLVVGGHGASMLPRLPLEAGADAVVRGEGESALRLLLEQGLQADLPGVVLRGAGDLASDLPAAPLIQPLDRLPSPARDLIAVPANGVHLLETSRGCPHSCRFCETTRFYGRRWRPFSPGRVAAEVRRLVRDFGAWIIEITDDNFAADHRRVMDICRELSKEELPAFFLLSARADDLHTHKELLPAMAAARMLRISVGVETLSPQLARSAGKYIPLEVYQGIFERMRELKMFSVASFIVGLPGELPSERAGALEAALAVAPDSAQFIPFYPFREVPMAALHQGLDPAPDAVRDAERFTVAFYRHVEVENRLRQAEEGSDIRARLARGTLEKYADRISVS